MGLQSIDMSAVLRRLAEKRIEDAMQEGKFDNLPGAGKPLEGLTGQHDPDWWIRRKIEREQLSDLGTVSR